MRGRPELPILVEAILAVENLIMEQAERTQAPAHPYIRSDRIEGTAVYAADGSRIGTIKYLEIEKVSGQVIYAITSFNSFLAVRADTHTIPWSRLTYDPQLHGYRTDITQEQLHNAPEFSRGDEFDWPEQERERLHRYWHSPPYGGM
jgi:sporulation protein YlmC with PRC-barrel domain